MSVPSARKNASHSARFPPSATTSPVLTRKSDGVSCIIFVSAACTSSPPRLSPETRKVTVPAESFGGAVRKRPGAEGGPPATRTS